MSDGFQFLDIIFFALIAVFLLLRLRGVLGRRSGHEKPPGDVLAKRDIHKDASKRPGGDRGKVVPLAGGKPAPVEEVAEGGANGGKDTPSGEGDTPPAPQDAVEAGLGQIRAADSNFDADEFLSGAGKAFEIIVAAFAAGDVAALRPLLNDDVFDNFQSAIDARAESGETLETTLIGIKSAEILEAGVEGHDSALTVKFVSEQVNVTRDAGGAVVDGDGEHIAAVTDIWTFARNSRSRDPNWALVATQSPN